jgi:membrane-bound ClpP family serine protease
VTEKRDTSGLKAWWLALASLIDDVLFLVILFVVLKFFHIKITWEIILTVVASVVVFFFIIHKAIVPAIRRRKINGTEALMGEVGIVTQTLNPSGIIKIKDEYWKAISIEATINAGEEVEIVGISGLVLKTKKKNQ